MKQQHTIISKRTSPFVYTKYIKVNGNFFRDGPGIVINGGAGLVGGAELLSGRPLNKRDSLIPVGVHTYVDDDVLEKLMSIGKFRHDIERGIIVVVKNQKCDQNKTDKIAASDMIEDENIPTRPVTEEEISRSGGKVNSDGSIDISNVDDGMSPLKIRKIDAGQPDYIKRRNAESRKSASRRRRKTAEV